MLWFIEDASDQQFNSGIRYTINEDRTYTEGQGNKRRSSQIDWFG